MQYRGRPKDSSHTCPLALQSWPHHVSHVSHIHPSPPLHASWSPRRDLASTHLAHPTQLTHSDLSVQLDLHRSSPTSPLRTRTTTASHPSGWSAQQVSFRTGTSSRTCPISRSRSRWLSGAVGGLVRLRQQRLSRRVQRVNRGNRIELELELDVASRRC